MGGVKTHLTPFLSRGAGHDPLREVLILLRAAVTIPCKSPYSSLGLPSQYPKRGPYSSPGLQVTIPWEVFSQVRLLRLMVTMATNPFRESMGQSVVLKSTPLLSCFKPSFNPTCRYCICCRNDISVRTLSAASFVDVKIRKREKQFVLRTYKSLKYTVGCPHISQKQSA